VPACASLPIINEPFAARTIDVPSAVCCASNTSAPAGGTATSAPPPRSARPHIPIPSRGLGTHETDNFGADSTTRRQKEIQEFLTSRRAAVTSERAGLPTYGPRRVPGPRREEEQLAGCKSFGIWPLSQAAEACFGTSQWPTDRPTPQTSIEFDVANARSVTSAARELEQAGYELLHEPREEPWGQTVARLQSPEGAIIGISHIPSFHDQA
jgi:hypothetical protein